MLHNKRSLGIFLWLLLVLLLTSLLTPWVELLHIRIDGRLAIGEGRVSFSDVFIRLYVTLAISLLLLFRRMLGVESLDRLGLGRKEQSCRDLLGGFFTTLLSVAVLVVAMSMRGIFTLYFRLSWPGAMGRVAMAMISAVAASLLEEISRIDL